MHVFTYVYTMLFAHYKNLTYIFFASLQLLDREHSGSAVECLTRDRRAAGSSLTGVTVLCP